jgi:hypothetical protein
MNTLEAFELETPAELFADELAELLDMSAHEIANALPGEG